MDSLAPKIPFHPLYGIFSEFHPSRAAVDLNDSNGNPVRVYPTTNEKDTHDALETLSSSPPLGNSLITLSGIQALEQFAFRVQDVEYLFHIDPNREMKRLWNIFLESIHAADTPATAINLILTTVKTQYSELKVFKRLEKYFRMSIHLFSFSFTWERLKDAVEKGKIFSLCLDLSDEDRIERFCTLMHDNGFFPDSLYLANLSQQKWLGEDKVHDIVHRIRNLNPHQCLYIIHASICTCLCSKTLVQRVQKISPKNLALHKPSCLHQASHRINLIMGLYMTLTDAYENMKASPHIDFPLEVASFRTFRAKIKAVSAFDLPLSSKFEQLLNLLIVFMCCQSQEDLLIFIHKKFPGMINHDTSYGYPIPFAITTITRTAILEVKTLADPKQLRDYSDCFPEYQ